MSQIDQTLHSISRLGFDTAPLIYFIERNPKYIDLVKEIIQRVDDGEIYGYTSVRVITEVLSHPKRLENTAIESEYRNFLMQSRNFELIPIDAAIAEHASSLRARYNLRTPDALQIAACISTNCDAFLTNDRTLQRVTEIRVLYLDSLIEDGCKCCG